MKEGERVVVDFSFEVPLRKGRYSISVAARVGERNSYLDWVDIATTLRIKRPRDQAPSRSLMRLPTQIKLYAPEGERQGRSV